MTFEHWLKQYLDIGSPIGDLARDYKKICRQYNLDGKKRPKLTLEHLQNHYACEDSMEAFNKARNLYATFSINSGKR